MNISIQHEERLLNALLALASKIRWDGFEQDSFYHGLSVYYSGVCEGFEITVRKYDSRSAYSSVRHSIHLAGHDEVCQNWMEISVKDKHARYGRRVILKQLIYSTDDQFYPKVEQIFEIAKKEGFLFRPSNTDRLGKDHSVSQFITELEGFVKNSETLV